MNVVSTALLTLIYLSFISLGLPDAVLGAAWPTMSVDLGAPILSLIHISEPTRH